MFKCQHLSNVTSRMDSLVRVMCVYGSSPARCMKMVANDSADVITLGEELIYEAGFHHGLVPIVAEDYGEHEEGLSNYAVALIKRNLSKDISFRSLGKARACHPAAGNLIGWTVPAGLLIGLDVMPWKNCDPYQSSAEFFLESCVPGALSYPYNQNGTNPPSLCAICSDQKACPPNVSERYYGYRGAYRCLTEDAGDVAFVSHLTVFEYTGSDNKLNPGKDFQLLCTDGTRADVGAFQKCNLARIPSRTVMSRAGDSLTSLKQSLLHLDYILRTQSNSFPLFKSSAYGGGDLLFKDSTVKLIDVKKKNSTRTWLGENFFLALQTLRSCQEVIAAARSFTVEVKSLGTGQLLLIELFTVVSSLR